MQTQNLFIAHPTNAEQINVLKAVVKAFKIKFEVTATEEPYKPEFVAKIEKSQQDYKDGKGTAVTLDELNNLWK
jgi:hypothetical protein